MAQQEASVPTTDIVGGLIRTAALVQDICAATSSEHGLTPQQAQLMCVVGDTPSSMIQLGALLRVGKSTMTGLVHRAEQAGLIERAPDPEDRRSTLITLTNHGLRTNTAFRESVSRQIQRLMTTLPTTEQASLSAILTTIVNDNKAPDTWPSTKDDN